MATRGNPFAPNTELKRVLKSIPPPPTAPEVISPTHSVYQELNPPKPQVSVASEDEGEGPAIPPMRVTGFIQGAQLSAILQVGNAPNAQFVQATPGKTVQYGQYTYKVERLEQDKVVLVNRWELGNRSGVQRIEVTLAGSARPGESE